MVRRVPKLLVLLLALLLPASLWAATRKVPIDEFHPTQPGVGKAAAMLYIKHWEHEAKRRDMSLKKYAKKVLQRKLDTHLTPAIIDPDGNVRNTDAHHHITAMLELKEMTGVTLTARAKILADYRGQSEAEYAHDFVGRLKKGWFGPNAAGMSDVDKVRSLPKTYARMKNDPLRSAVEAAFERLGLDGKMFTDYIEFKVGAALVENGIYERLRQKGILEPGARTIPDELVFKKKVAKQIVKMLRKPALRTLLAESARTKANARRIDAALGE